MVKNSTKYVIHFLIWGVLWAVFFRPLPCIAQENVIKLIKEGTKLNEEEVEQLQKTLETNPENLATRSKLLSYYFENRMQSDLQRNAYQKHLMWIIQNRPEAEVLGKRIAQVSSRDSSFYNEVKELWLNQIKIHHNNAIVLDNAAELFLRAGMEVNIDTLNKRVSILTNYDKPYLYPDLDLGEELLKKAQILQPDKSKWPEKLARLYVRTIKYKSGEEKRKEIEKALEHFEIALSLTMDEKSRFNLLRRMANTAMRVDKLAQAKTYADKLLKLAPQYTDDRNYGDAIHRGNLILCEFALQSDNLEEAKKYLIEAGKTPGGKVLNFSGPDTTLAKKLLVIGEREAVIQILSTLFQFLETRVRSFEELDSYR